jgi:subtilase family serine protease
MGSRHGTQCQDLPGGGVLEHNAGLFYAETVAAGLVAAAGGSDISNSWGEGEFSGETNYDDYFRYSQYPQVSHITFFASAGDSGCGATYPSSSPWVVSAGGTTINRDSSGNFASETCRPRSGGGTSSQETWSNTFRGGISGHGPIFSTRYSASPAGLLLI